MQGGSQTPLRSLGPTSFDKKHFTILIVEIGFCRDLGCDTKLEIKTEKYSSLISALKKYWGRMEFVAFPIGHAGTTLKATLDHLTAAFSIVRPHVEQARANRGATDPTMGHNAKTHDFGIFKSLLDSLTDLAQSRLIGTISNRKRLVDSLHGEASRHRAHSAAPPSHPLTARQGAATQTHRMRTTRISESTAIT
jgi:hypothetical protein